MASFIDANLILRYLLNDPEADSVEQLFQKQEELILSSLVVAEVVWTLTSFYRWPKPEIIPPLLSLIRLPFIKTDKNLILNALEIYHQHNIDYIDAYLVALMNKRGVKTLYSYDRHFDKVKSIKRRRP